MEFKTSVNCSKDKELEIINASQSSLGQDLFVIAMTEGKKNGKFFEIGAGHPKIDSNCYLLENMFDWSGVSIDIEDRSIFDNSSWQTVRPKSNFILQNALNIDYSQFEKFYDFLQIDIDDPSNCFYALEKITNCIEFSVIIYEHNLFKTKRKGRRIYYRFKNRASKLLRDRGYICIINDVCLRKGQESAFNEPYPVEDWYVNPKFLKSQIIETYKSFDCEPKYKFYTEFLLNNFN